MLRDDESQNDEDEDESPSKGRENEVTIELLIREKSSSNNEKSSNELNLSKASALDSIKQDLKLEETGEAIDDEFATVVANLLTKGMQDERPQDRLNEMARPENCEALIKVNQLVWDNLSSKIISQDPRIQRVQTSLIKGLTCVVRATDKILTCLNDICVGKDVT